MLWCLVLSIRECDFRSPLQLFRVKQIAFIYLLSTWVALIHWTKNLNKNDESRQTSYLLLWLSSRCSSSYQEICVSGIPDARQNNCTAKPEFSNRPSDHIVIIGDEGDLREQLLDCPSESTWGTFLKKKNSFCLNISYSNGLNDDKMILKCDYFSIWPFIFVENFIRKGFKVFYL